MRRGGRKKGEQINRKLRAGKDDHLVWKMVTMETAFLPSPVVHLELHIFV